MRHSALLHVAALLAAVVAACSGPVAHTPPAAPPLAGPGASPAPPTPSAAATPAPIDPHAVRAAGATVALLDTTCQAGHGWLWLHGDSRLVQERCGAVEVSFAVDAEGTFGSRQGYDLGLADFEDRDQLQSLQVLGSRTGLAFRDLRTAAGTHTVRTRIDVRDGSAWKTVYGSQPDGDGEFVVGLGTWPELASLPGG